MECIRVSSRVCRRTLQFTAHDRTVNLINETSEVYADAQCTAIIEIEI